MFRQSPLFEFRHGDHTCVFYRSVDALMEVLSPYVAAGILNGERCFCAQKPEVIKRLIFDLRFLGIDTDREIKRGALELRTEEDTYFVNKRFEPTAMIEMLHRSIDESVKQGFSAFRSAGELGWAVRGANFCDQVLEYEMMVQNSYPGKPAIGLCQYSLNDFSPEVLEGVLKSHRLHIDESKKDSLYSSLQVRYDSHAAEIVADKFVIDPRYYYVVQQLRRREVVGWGIAPSFDSAARKAEGLASEAR